MGPRRVLLLHGWQGSGAGHWQPWLAAELRGAGQHVRFPELPGCDAPCPDQWGATLHAELAALAALPGGERVVCAHSLGCVLWFREAARIAPELRVDRVVLVAPPCPGARVAELARFYPTRADRDAVAAAAATRGSSAPTTTPTARARAPRSTGAEPLGLAVDLLPGRGHLNTEAGFGPWPALRDWVLGGVPAPWRRDQ
jgi:predicted alpha/beta hydrolase family esterase